jgi:hypothetical protein
LVTDAIFSVIVTYIFLKPMLEVLQTAGGNVRTEGSRRLERTKWWNFTGVLVTVGSSTVLYLNMIAYFVLVSFRQYFLSRSVWGNPFAIGLALDSILNTLGMILLSGMFKDASLPSCLAGTPKNKAELRGQHLRGAVNWDRSDFKIAPEIFRPIGYSTSSGSMSISAMSSSTTCSTIVLDAATILGGSNVVTSPPKSPESKSPAITSPPKSPRATSAHEGAKCEEQNALMLAILIPPSR